MASKHVTKANKLVRDSFTIPKVEFATIDLLKTRAIGLGTSVKKSELLRAGLMVLKSLSDASFKSAIAAVPTLKTGRPSADQTAKPVTKPAVKAVAQPAPKAPAKPVRKAAAKPAAKPTPKPAAKAPVAKVAAAIPATPAPAAKPARTARAATPRKRPTAAATKTA